VFCVMLVTVFVAEIAALVLGLAWIGTIDIYVRLCLCIYVCVRPCVRARERLCESVRPSVCLSVSLSLSV
jgi:hypothetical protein